MHEQLCCWKLLIRKTSQHSFITWKRKSKFSRILCFYHVAGMDFQKSNWSNCESPTVFSRKKNWKNMAKKSFLIEGRETKKPKLRHTPQNVMHFVTGEKLAYQTRQERKLYDQGTLDHSASGWFRDTHTVYVYITMTHTAPVFLTDWL